jgi:O-antigen ligase
MHIARQNIMPYLLEFSLYAAVTMLTFSEHICNIFLLVATGASLVIFATDRVFSRTLALAPLIMFFVFALSFLNTTDIRNALARFELWSSYLFIPLIFGFAGHVITERIVHNATRIFSAVIILACFVSYGRIVLISGQFFPSNDAQAYSYHDPFSRFSFSEFLHVHPVYLSMYIIFAVVVVFNTPRLHIVLRMTLLFALAFFLMILSSKNQVLVFLIVMLVVLWRYLKIGFKIKLGVMLAVMAVVITIGIHNKQLQYRFKNEGAAAFGERLLLWSAGAEIIAQHPVFGVGIGDIEDTLLTAVKAKEPSWEKNYNLHNQYLDFAMAFGIIGLLVFAFLLALPFFMRVDFTFMLLLLIIATSAFSESIFYRHKGMVFFLVFYGLLGSRYALASPLHFRSKNS